MRLASCTVENFFPAGAENDLSTITQAQYESQRDQIRAAIADYLKRPDVIGLQEVALFADKPNQLAHLARVLGGSTAYIEPGNDTRRITAGFLVNDGVTVNGVTQLGKAETIPDSGCGDAGSGGCTEPLFGRPPLAIDVTKGSRSLVYITNHWASQSHDEVKCRDRQADCVRGQAAALEATGRQVVVGGDLRRSHEGPGIVAPSTDWFRRVRLVERPA